ncbi:serine/threonine-protein kinase [Streptomyces pathocidini]|uniref:serine/threonine-protein kinase n=1 Tax=Streptomyces pathocidini TaxID=1650571 RepID=UPI0033FC1C51
MGSFRGEGDRLIAGRYRLGARLGRGGMGTVWRATDLLLGRQVAVKELAVDPGLSEEEAWLRRERMLREARTVAQLRHPGVVVVHDVVEQDERPWIVMELVDGRSLAERLAHDGPVEPREAARIGLALLGALRVAHAQGVLHRDIKPANVLVEAGEGRVVLTDFGVAHVSGGSTITDSGSFVGTPEYTAPERMSGGRSGPASDLWSLGALLCAATSGRSPFHRDSLSGVLHAVVSDDIRLPEAARPLLPVVAGLLERDPERRLAAGVAEGLLRDYLRTGRMGELPSGGGWLGAHGAHAPREGSPSAGAGGLLGGLGGRPGSRARTVVAAALLMVAAGGVGVAAMALLMDGDEGAGGGGGATGSQSAPDGSTASPDDGRGTGPSSGVTPSTGTTPSVTASDTGGPALPSPGYRAVADAGGFRVAVPEGFVRTANPLSVYYSSPDKAFRLAVRIQHPSRGGPLEALRAADAEGASRFAGYRESEVSATTTRGGRPGAVRHFVWDGPGPDGGPVGPRRVAELAWEDGGRAYELAVSGPLAQRDTVLRHFTMARDSFAAGRG